MYLQIEEQEVSYESQISSWKCKKHYTRDVLENETSQVRHS